MNSKVFLIRSRLQQLFYRKAERMSPYPGNSWLSQIFNVSKKCLNTIVSSFKMKIRKLHKACLYLLNCSKGRLVT